MDCPLKGIQELSFATIRPLPMRMRTRKLLGTIALLVFVLVYSLAAMMVAIALQVNASKFVEMAYYVVAGLIWVIPAGAIIWWMQKE
jgi:hypothetical protein